MAGIAPSSSVKTGHPGLGRIRLSIGHGGLQFYQRIPQRFEPRLKGRLPTNQLQWPQIRTCRKIQISGY